MVSRKTAYRLIILFTIIILFIAAAESIIRINGWMYSYTERRSDFFVDPYDEQLPSWLFANTPNFTWKDETSEFSYELITNKDGLRDVNHPIEKDSNEIRIVALGDSYTQGIGAPNDSSWSVILKNLLESKFSQRKLTVFRGGVSGSDPFFETMLFKLNFMKYNPDIVLLAINQSDIEDVMVRGGANRFMPDSTVKFNEAPPISPLFKYSHLVRYYYIFLKNYDWLYLPPNKRDEKEIEAAKLIANEMIAFNIFCKSKGITFIPVMHPIMGEVFYNEYFSKMDTIKNNLIAADIPFCNLYSYYSSIGLNKDNVSNYYWKIDGHHNSNGYSKFAQGVYNCIVKQIAPKEE